jgi:hypothetical protein
MQPSDGILRAFRGAYLRRPFDPLDRPDSLLHGERRDQEPALLLMINPPRPFPLEPVRCLDLRLNKTIPLKESLSRVITTEPRSTTPYRLQVGLAAALDEFRSFIGQVLTESDIEGSTVSFSFQS